MACLDLDIIRWNLRILGVVLLGTWACFICNKLKQQLSHLKLQDFKLLDRVILLPVGATVSLTTFVCHPICPMYFDRSHTGSWTVLDFSLEQISCPRFRLGLSLLEWYFPVRWDHSWHHFVLHARLLIWTRSLRQWNITSRPGFGMGYVTKSALWWTQRLAVDRAYFTAGTCFPGQIARLVACFSFASDSASAPTDISCWNTILFLLPEFLMDCHLMPCFKFPFSIHFIGCQHSELGVIWWAVVEEVLNFGFLVGKILSLWTPTWSMR